MYKSIKPTIINTVEHFKPFYENTHKSHGLQHAVEVMWRALNINKKLKLMLESDIIIVATIAHDMFTSVDKMNHHTLACDYILKATDGIFKDMSHVNKVIISCAISEHRASYKGEYTTTYSMLLSAADREPPNLENIIKRLYKYVLIYNRDVKGNIDNIVPKVYDHLIVKYSRTGYARYCDYYKAFYSHELEQLFYKIDNISITEINRILETTEGY